MTDDNGTPRPSLSSIDARIGRLEVGQVERDGAMALVTAEQRHIREMMDSRFGSLESHVREQGSKLDEFIGEMRTLITKGIEQQTELSASPLGRAVDERMKRTESWVEISKDFHAEQRGQRKVITGLVGTNAFAAAAALAALGKAMGWI